MYVAVKGGEQAIANAHALLAKRGRGESTTPRLTPDQVREQLGVLVSRVMTEGSLYDEDLAARAVAQSQGDVLEAITLVRTYRTTLPRFGTTVPVDTAALPAQRRVSATFKDVPGGQQLGATFDYTHRLLSDPTQPPVATDFDDAEPMPRVTDILGAAALLEPASSRDAGDDPDPADLTRDPTVFPMTRAGRMQALARGDEGFLLGMGYSTLRGYGNTHPFVGEVRVGQVEVGFVAPELGFEVCLGRIEVTECQLVAQFVGSAEVAPMFTRGYGLAFGRSERKALSMSLVDRSMRADELAERKTAPAHDEEFVVEHADNVQATGFVEHLKLPHYVDFQA
ncbi:MAG: carbon-phosphorus lyase complex subunit PhnI, partial [Micrococcales bacterium]|nr:carbon-phosphorus lyase complex subunit PhnI [Micrococcales bacterium]